MCDDDLLRCSTSPDFLAVVEANRRLREALHAEETAIKRLTVGLFVFTVIIAILTGVLVWLELVHRQ
jgi:hypothetical protein